jgi:DNA polymerase I-like protein with 3'-5' exonuclease and polymerase domains
MIASFPAHSVRQAAAFYLGLGFAPLPVPSRAKQPVLSGWPDLRVSAPELADYFPDSRETNIGLILHDQSRLVDLDLDCPEAVGAGRAWLPLSNWVSGRAGKPMSHYWYAADARVAYQAYDDVDGTRLLERRAGNGHQTVVPPGTHESGDEIAWDHLSGRPTPIVAAEAVRLAGEVAALAILARHWPQTNGKRQDLAMALAGGLVRAGWAVDKVELFLGTLVDVAGDEQARQRVKVVVHTAAKVDQGAKVKGWPTLVRLLGTDGGVVVDRVRVWLGLAADSSGREGPPGASAPRPTIRRVTPYRPFPVDALPPPLDRLVTQGATALGCDPAYVALPALAVVASAIGNARAIRLKRGWEEPSILWAVVVGDSGTTKTPAFKLAVRHLYAVQADLLDQFRREKEEWEAAMGAWEAADVEDRGERPAEPRLQKAICSDTTIEKLAEILEDSPRGVLVARDELAGWFGSFSRYKGQKGGTDLPNWLEMFSAGTIMVDRKTGPRPTIFVKRAAAGVTGGIQPGVLARALTQEFLDSGLAARLLMAMPPKRPKAWSEVEVDPDTEAAYHALVDTLRALEFDDDPDRGRGPHVLTLSAEAKAAWVAHYDHWAGEQSAVEGELAAAYSKLEAYAARLALVHHVVTHAALEADDRRPVGPKSVAAGIALCAWFAGEARRIYTTLAETEEERECRRLVEFIRSRGGRITVRELMRANCRRYPDAATAEAALGGLVDAGLARWVDVPTTMQGGLPIKGIELVEFADEVPKDDPEAHDTDDSGSDPGPDPEPPPTGGSPPSSLGPESGVSSVMCHTHANCFGEGPGPADQPERSCHTGPVQPPNAVITDPCQAAGLGQAQSVQSDNKPGTVQRAIANDYAGGRRDRQSPNFSDELAIPVESAMHVQQARREGVDGKAFEHPDSQLDGTADQSGTNQATNKNTCMTHDTDDTECAATPVSLPVACDWGVVEAHDAGEEGIGTGAVSVVDRSGGVGSVMHSSGLASFVAVDWPDGLSAVVAAVEESALVGLDCETTGLNPRSDRVRLLAVDCDTADGGRVTYLVDVGKIDPTPLGAALAEAQVVIHNAAFDLGFLGRLGFAPKRVHDTLLLSQVLHARAHTRGVAPLRHGLKDCVARELGLELAKDLQSSDWSGPLTADQLAYAATDAAVLVPLFRSLTEKLVAARLTDTAAIESAAVPCLAWLSAAGVPFDVDRWRHLARAAHEDADRTRSALDAAAPERPGSLFGESWNWDSPEQVKDALELAGCTVESTADGVLAALDHPLAALLRDYRDAQKRATTYGEPWLKHVAADGRVYPRWVQLGANSGRMACAAPNMQNLPRGAYRKCVAAKPGRVLVKADYSQVELRIAAKVSGDKALMAAYERGEDLHTLTARQVLGIAEVTKDHRQLAKALNFGLLYGMGTKGFRNYARSHYGLELTEEQAAGYRDAFFKAYPGLRRWHRSVVDGPQDMRTLAGRRAQRVEHFNEKLNLPVQGTGADGLKRALALLWERRTECPTAIPVLVVHDEIVVECPEADADQAADWLKRAMLDGMAPLVAPVPVEVEVKVGRTWGGD